MIAFGVETEYNVEMVTNVMNSKILAKEYDMVSYIISDYYEVVIGEAIEKGSIFPKNRNGIYMDYIKEQVISVASIEYDKEELLKAFSIETIAKKLKEEECYTIDIVCELDGEVYNKRFMYYEVDRKSKFYICFGEDITEVLREEKLRNEQLKNALREANQANIAKTAFLSSMSHEIRTPMNAIIGLDSIALKEPNLSENTREYLEKIGNSARYLLGLINDILDVSRIESGRMILKQEEFSFKKMIEEINSLDDGFEALYGKIKKELEEKKEQHKSQIRKLQGLIEKITEKSSSIQAIEARNKSQMDLYFTKQKKELQSRKSAMSVARDYYQNMSKSKHAAPQFLDKKK